MAGIDRYEHELRGHTAHNHNLALALALDINATSQQMPFGQLTGADRVTHPDGTPDFGQIVLPLALKHYD